MIRVKMIRVKADFPMAHLWIQDAGSWAAKKLFAERIDLASLATGGGEPVPPAPPGESQVLLVRADVAGAQVWALVAAETSGARVNGEEPAGGLRVLADRDAMRTADGRLCFFSTETLATVELFQGAGRPVFCGRCRQQIEPGTGAVRCPGCGVWYNQGPELPCWTYAETCAFCGNPTALDSGFRWVPEE